MQPKEQRVELLESLPDQDEYQVAQPKRKTTSRGSSSELSKGPTGRTGPQAIARSVTTSTSTSESRDPGQRRHGSYQKADELTVGLHLRVG